MADTAGTPSSRVTPFWAILWLVAVFVIGITASVVLYNYQLVDTQPTARLTGMLLIGEVLLYFIVLMVPAEGIVPPGRTLLVVLVAMGGRAAMAMGAAKVATLTGAQAGFQQLWLDFYTGFWLAALVQMLMIFVYLWLIRSALEVSRPGVPVPQQRPPQDMDYASEFRIPAPPTDEDTKQRQEQLLSALMENPEAPVEETDEAAEQLLAEAGVEPPAEADDATAAEQGPAPDHPAGAVPPDAEAALQPETQQPSEAPPSPEPKATEPETEQAEPGQMTMDLSEPRAPEEAEDEAGEATDSLPPVPALLADEELEPPTAQEEPQPASAPGAGPDSEQEAALQAAASNVVEGETVETAVSGTGRIYALIGLAPLPADTSLLDSLDALFAALMAATQAIHAGSAKSLVLMADAGTLVGAASRDRASQILIRGGADAKLGQLSLLARHARAAAADLDLGDGRRDQPIEQSALLPDEPQSRQATEKTGQQVLAFTGSTYSILTTAAAADAAIIAAAAECAYDAAGVVAEAMHLGAVDRLLVEGDGAGLVVGRCDAAALLVIAAETTAKMGAANIALTKLRAALRGEA